MKPEDILDSMNNIDDEIITDAQGIRSNKLKKKVWVKWITVAACFCLIVGAVLGHFHFNPITEPKPSPPVNNLLSFSLINAVYPSMSKYPVETDFDNGQGELDYMAYSDAVENWYDEFEARLKNTAQADKYSRFFTATAKTFLSDTNSENLVYSPVNVYMALSMLAESTDGNTRKEILDLLGADSVDELRTLATRLWLSNYADDGVTTNILANSVWLRDGTDYNKATLDTLASKYYASSFRGEMGSDSYNQALQGWLNEQTGGLLKEQAYGAEFDHSTVLGLASTVYFKARWMNEFSEHATEPDPFYGTKDTKEVDFMKQTTNDMPFYSDDNYTATALPFNNSGRMWLILPDEGITPETLIKDGEINPILSGNTPKNVHNSIIINLSVPKFDVASSTDLIEGIQKLGVSDVFDELTADFTPIMPNQSGYVSQINHSARVTVDEEGCTAAAFTLIGVDTEAFIEANEIDFILNRPFIFVITADDSTPLFVGIINNV